MSSLTAKMIKETRINGNLSQEEAAKALGITDRTLSLLKTISIWFWLMICLTWLSFIKQM